MINGRNFYIKSTDPDRVFHLHHGVQQGSVTGPTLFIHYISDILHLYNINVSDELKAVMFADDLIVNVAGRNPREVQDNLTKVVNSINVHCTTWHLKVNLEKCEIILFRPPVSNRATKNRAG